jgi:hypothetical protein
MAKIIPFTLKSSFREGKESGYANEERRAREFFALSEEERERAMVARAAALLKRNAKKLQNQIVRPIP